MRFRSIVPAVVAALAVGGFSAYAANSHSSNASTRTATALVQTQIHSERLHANASDTITPIGGILPIIPPGTVPNTGTQTATQTLVQVHVAVQAQATQGTDCETGEKDSQDEGDSAQAQGATETESGDQTRSGDQNEAATEGTGAASQDETQAACVPPTAACIAARDALKALAAADKTEDRAEPKPTTDAEIAADKTEDAADKQALKTAVQAVIAACGGQHED